MNQQTPVTSREDITAWLIDWISRELEMDAAGIDPARSLLEYSLSSVTATILVGDLEDWLDLTLPPTLVWDYPSIEAMTEYLLTTAAGATPVSAAPVEAEKLLEGIDQMSDEEVEALLNKLS